MLILYILKRGLVISKLWILKPKLEAKTTLSLNFTDNVCDRYRKVFVLSILES